jgi:hypothetical protein
MDHKIPFSLLFVCSILLACLGVQAADPDIVSFYAVPNSPYVYSEFEIYVRAEDDDGIDRIKFYVEDRLDETEECNGDEVCRVHFYVKESEVGYHEYKVKVYDEEGNTESDEMRVLVRGYTGLIPPEPYDGAPTIQQYYASPSQPYTGQGFSIYASAYDSSGMKKIELWHGGLMIGARDCYGSTCSDSFSVAPKYTTSSYVFYIRAYDVDNRMAQATLTVNVQGYTPPANNPPVIISSSVSPSSIERGDSIYLYMRATDDQGLNRLEVWEGSSLRGGWNCGSSRDCSYTFSLGSMSSGSYSFTLKAVDNNGLQSSVSKGVVVKSVVVYTCNQLGGRCCSQGGTGLVLGSTDCPSSCYQQCLPQPPSGQTSPPTTPTQPSGMTVAIEDTSLLLLGMMFIMLILILYIAVKVR